MSSHVRIAELKASLSACLRRVRLGETMTVLDRDTPVAKLVPIDAAGGSPHRVRRARGNLTAMQRPKPLRTRADIVALLMEERGER